MTGIAKGAFNPSNMTPRQFWEVLFKPRVDMYLADPTCLWKAYSAAEAISATVRWTYWYYSFHGEKKEPYGAKTDDQFFRQLDCRHVNVGFIHIQYIADASKHRWLDRKEKKQMHDNIVGGLYRSSETFRGEHLYYTVTPSYEEPFEELVRRMKAFWENVESNLSDLQAS